MKRLEDDMGCNFLENGNGEDITDATKLYGVFCQLYQETKKTRPDLTPKENFFAISLGSNNCDSLEKAHGRILQLANAIGLNLNMNNYKKVMGIMIKQKMVAFSSCQEGKKFWTFIELKIKHECFG